jgi:hypothetical protein
MVFCFFLREKKKKRKRKKKKGEMAGSFPQGRLVVVPVPAHTDACARTSLAVMYNKKLF